MGRPLAVIGFSYLAALVVAFFLGLERLPILIIVSVCLSVIFLISRKTEEGAVILTVCISSAAAFGWLMAFSTVYVQPTEQLYGKTAVVTGQICDLPYEKNGRTYYKLETSEILLSDCVQHTKILVSSQKALRADLYDTVTATVNIYPQSDDSYKYYNISRGNYLTGSLDSYKDIKITTNEEKPLYYYALCIRRYMLDTIGRQLPKEQAGFVSAILLGDKSRLSSENKAAFSLAGISHIIAVSGFHLSVITQLMMLLFTALCAGRKRAASFICIAFVFMYMAVVGFTPSVVRAGIMQILFLFSQTAITKTDSFNSLGLAAIIICFVNPYTSMDIGFLLSLFATFGIALWGKRMNDYIINRIYPKDNVKPYKHFGIMLVIETPVRALTSLITVSLSAMALTTPIILIYFKSIAPYTLLTNILVSFAASVLIFSSFIMVFLRMSVIFTFLESPFITVSGILSNYITGAANFVSTLPFSQISLSTEFVPICIMLSVLLFTLLFVVWKGKKYILAAVYIICVIFIFSGGYHIETMLKQDSIKLNILDCGEGITLIVSDDYDTSVLSCGGSYDKSYNVNSFLSDNGIGDISYMLIMGDENSTSANAENFLENYNVNTVQIYDEEKQLEHIHRLVKSCDNVIYSRSDTDKIETVHINDTDIFIYKTENCSALYFELYGKSFLICNKGTDCAELPETWLNTDYLIVSGSVTKPELICAGQIIISNTRENLDGDMAQFETEEDKIYYTAGFGNIGIRIYPNSDSSIRREGYWLS